MNKLYRLQDFIIFILVDYDELNNNIIHFFHQIREDENPFDLSIPIIYDYKEYIKEHLEPLPKELFSTTAYSDDFTEYEELFSERNESILLQYLNTNYIEGFPDEGLPQYLSISSEDLERYFDRYMQFKNINNKVYISYFLQFLYSIERKAIKGLIIEMDRIDEFKAHYESLGPKLRDEFRELKKKEYKHELYDSINNNDFQFLGAIEDYAAKLIFIGLEETLNQQLKMLPIDFNDYTLDLKDTNIKSRLSYLSLQYLNKTYFGIEPEYSKENKTEQELAQNELDALKHKHSKLITYLDSKNFELKEIDILFNLLFENKFSALGIRYHPLTTQVSIYHILHCFYILEFYECELNYISDFNKLIANITLLKETSAQQFYKYYRDNNHPPFIRINVTLEILNNKLGIDREKLKKIP